MLDKIINELAEKIDKSVLSSNLVNIFSDLDKIHDNTLICGIGGSNVVATFLQKVLNAKNNIIAKSINVEEFFLSNNSNYKNLIAVSHSGTNNAIKRLMKSNINKYLFTTRKTKISNETLLNYIVENRIKSFVSLDDTFIPISILLCYYLDLYQFPLEHIPIEEDFCKLNSFDKVNIIYDYNSITTATFLETCITEAGIASVTMHTKYSLCHGRSNLINNLSSLVIHLVTNGSELDSMLTEELPKITSNISVLQVNEKDSIIADYKLMFNALYFLKHLDKEFVNVKYNKIIPTLYNFKGGLV